MRVRLPRLHRGDRVFLMVYQKLRIWQLSVSGFAAKKIGTILDRSVFDRVFGDASQSVDKFIESGESREAVRYRALELLAASELFF